MNIRDIFALYSERMTQIHLYQRAMQAIAKKELEELYKYEKSIESHPDLNDLSSSYHNMFFRTAKDGAHRFFGSKKHTVEDRKLSVVLHKNKQYQWLLAEAYEEFKDFLENAYAFAGYKDNNFWPLNDFGSISLSELKDMPFSWFLDQARRKKDIPSSIINKLRDSFPIIAALEVKNGLNVNLRLAIVLIEFLRHVIVHKSGVVTDKNEFKKRVLQKAGLYNNGKPDEDHVSYIDVHFGGGEYGNTISLLEVRVNPEIPLDLHVNVFGVLSGYLMAYAHLVFEVLDSAYNNSIQPTANASAD